MPPTRGEFVTETLEYDGGRKVTAFVPRPGAEAIADVFGTVFCASPGAGVQPPALLPSSLPRAYLVAGLQEPFFRNNAARWARALRGAGADVVMTERVGSHGDAFWKEEFPLMVAWAFGRRPT